MSSKFNVIFLKVDSFKLIEQIYASHALNTHFYYILT